MRFQSIQIAIGMHVQSSLAKALTVDNEVALGSCMLHTPNVDFKYKVAVQAKSVCINIDLKTH
jgi:hypothetical protein